jgi:TolA-binding protein
MKSLAANLVAAAVWVALANSNGFAQTSAPTPKSAATQTASAQTAQIQELTKKIDEQNAKIDMLSQQILKLQQAIASQRPDWRRRALNIGNIDIHFRVAGTVRQSRQRQREQSHRGPRRNAHLDRADA